MYARLYKMGDAIRSTHWNRSHVSKYKAKFMRSTKYTRSMKFTRHILRMINCWQWNQLWKGNRGRLSQPQWKKTYWRHNWLWSMKILEADNAEDAKLFKRGKELASPRTKLRYLRRLLNRWIEPTQKQNNGGLPSNSDGLQAHTIRDWPGPDPIFQYIESWLSSSSFDPTGYRVQIERANINTGWVQSRMNDTAERVEFG